MPNQHGGVLHRDSCESRLENILGIGASSPVSSENLTKFMEDSVSKGSNAKQSDFEADRIERDFLEGLASGRTEDDAWDTDDFSESQILSLSTSLNTAFNSSMSHRGSIAKALLQEQSLSRTPTPNLRRTSSQSISPEAVFNGRLGGSRRGSNESWRSSTWKRSSKSSSRSSQTEIRSPHASESSDFSATNVWEQRTTEPTKRLLEQPEITAPGSGQSTVVCSHRSSLMRMVGNQDSALSGDPTQNRSVPQNSNMLHLLAARLLQVSRIKSEAMEQEERESVV